MDTILQYIAERWPTLFVVIVAVAVAVWVTIRITKAASKINRVSDDLKEITNKIDKLPCAEHTSTLKGTQTSLNQLNQRIDTLPCAEHNTILKSTQSSLNQLNQRIENVSETMNTILGFLVARYPKTAGPVFSQKLSPRRLNEKGEEVFSGFGGNKFLDANEATLFSKIDAKTPKTAYDVEQDSLEVLYETLDSDIFNELKLKVYNSADIKIEKDGKEEYYSITMNDICFIFSLVLRDRYLAKHPEIPQSE
jgi:hypothetical protein